MKAFKLATAAFCGLVAITLEPPYIVHPRDGVILRFMFGAAALSTLGSLWVHNRRAHAAMVLPLILAYVSRIVALAAAAAFPSLPTPQGVVVRLAMWSLLAVYTILLWSSPVLFPFTIEEDEQ